MNHNAKIMLEALRNSENFNTREHAVDLLENRQIAWAPKGVTAEELAMAGRLGGLIAAIMTGDLTDSWRAADEFNKDALSDVIPEAYRE